MVDVPLPPQRRRTQITPRLLAIMKIMLVATLTVVLSWSAAQVLTDVLQRKCDNPVARLAVNLKLDQYYSGCKCMKPALDFRDPCNSQYIPVIL